MRLIVLRTGTCGVILHLHRNKLDVAEKGEDGPGAEAPVGGLGGGARLLPGVSGFFWGVFLPLVTVQ